MKYENNNLPDILNDYLEEIYNNEELRDAFYDIDIEIYDSEWLDDLLKEADWKDDFLTGGEPNYDVKPFARSGDGGLWVVLNDQMIGYMGTEGECGIVARNVNEFMNIAVMCKGCFFGMTEIKNEESFINAVNMENEEFEPHKVFDEFIEKHGFEKNVKEIYKIVKLGLTVKPFFVIKATDDEYVDSYSLLGADDGQDTLEYFIANYL